jgi:hypothetical protein
VRLLSGTHARPKISHTLAQKKRPPKNIANMEVPNGVSQAAVKIGIAFFDKGVRFVCSA